MIRKTGKQSPKAVAFMLVLILISIVAGINSALADSVEYMPVIDTLTVSYTSCIPGKDYSLLIFDGNDSQGNIGSGNLLFIDQLTASINGEIFIAFVAPIFEECTVFLGGVFPAGVSSPVRLGNYIPEEPLPEPDVILPEQLIRIEEEAFYSCAFTHVYLSDQVTSIGAYAFAASDSLTFVYIPDTTTAIAENAFAGSDNVVIGCHEGSYAQEYAETHQIPYRIIH